MLEAAGPGPMASYGLLFRVAENQRQRYALFLRVQDVAAAALARGAEQTRRLACRCGNRRWGHVSQIKKFCLSAT